MNSVTLNYLKKLLLCSLNFFLNVMKIVLLLLLLTSLLRNGEPFLMMLLPLLLFLIDYCIILIPSSSKGKALDLNTTINDFRVGHFFWEKWVKNFENLQDFSVFDFTEIMFAVLCANCNKICTRPFVIPILHTCRWYAVFILKFVGHDVLWFIIFKFFIPFPNCVTLTKLVIMQINNKIIIYARIK